MGPKAPLTAVEMARLRRQQQTDAASAAPSPLPSPSPVASKGSSSTLPPKAPVSHSSTSRSPGPEKRRLPSASPSSPASSPVRDISNQVPFPEADDTSDAEDIPETPFPNQTPSPDLYLSSFNFCATLSSGEPKYYDSFRAAVNGANAPGSIEEPISCHYVTAMLQPGESLAAIGVYDLAVTAGEASVYGALVDSARKETVRIYAPRSHPLPIVSCSPSARGPAKISFWSVVLEDQLPGLLKLQNRPFERLFECHRPDELERSAVSRPSSFRVLVQVSDDPLGRMLAPLAVPDGWAEAFGHVARSLPSNPNPVILVSGGRQSGKSTVSRLLTNSLLTDRSRRQTGPSSLTDLPPVFFLDLDPSDQEFGPDNQISLTLVQTITAGPPFTHPVSGSGNGNELIRAHAISAVGMRSDGEGFVQAAMELFQRYKSLRSVPDWVGRSKPSSLPLVIKTASSIRGVADECLYMLINQLSPYLTHLFALPCHPDSPLAHFDFPTHPSFTPHHLPLPPYTLSDRSSSELAVLKSIAYFHTPTVPAPAHQARWDFRPLSALQPLALRYATTSLSVAQKKGLGETETGLGSPENNPDTDFLGFQISCPLPSSIFKSRLASFVNGSLVAITVLTSDWLSSPDLESTKYGVLSVAVEHDPITHLPYLAYTSSSSPATSTTSPPSSLSPPEILPSLPSSRSRTVGWGLVRGVDSANGIVYLLTPLPPHLLQTLPANRTVLQAGLTAHPAWAFLQNRRGDNNYSSPIFGAPDSVAAAPGRIPWVRSTDDQGRSAFEGNSGQVLRIRGFGG